MEALRSCEDALNENKCSGGRKNQRLKQITFEALRDKTPMMHFLGFVAPAAKPEPAELIIPNETTLIAALLNAYENPAVATTAAMHLDVSARHPTWKVTLKRVRKLLHKVAAQHDEEAWVACGEVEDWCVITAPSVVSNAASVSALWAARR
jgi:hypothetical protein